MRCLGIHWEKGKKNGGVMGKFIRYEPHIYPLGSRGENRLQTQVYNATSNVPLWILVVFREEKRHDAKMYLCT